jgi:hypothetical protein
MSKGRGNSSWTGADTKHVCGIVAPDGARVSGRGFKISTELFEDLFDEEFHEVPAVSVTQIYRWPIDNNPNGGDTRDNAVFIAIGADRVRLKTGTPAGRKLAEPAHGRMR